MQRKSAVKLPDVTRRSAQLSLNIKVRVCYFATLSTLLLPMRLQAEAPFSFDTTPGKLVKDVVPRSYDTQLKPDIEKLTFTGSEIVVLDVRKPVKTITLNVNMVTIGSAKLLEADGKLQQTAQVAIDPKEQTATLSSDGLKS